MILKISVFSVLIWFNHCKQMRPAWLFQSLPAWHIPAPLVPDKRYQEVAFRVFVVLLSRDTSINISTGVRVITQLLTVVTWHGQNKSDSDAIKALLQCLSSFFAVLVRPTTARLCRCPGLGTNYFVLWTHQICFVNTCNYCFVRHNDIISVLTLFSWAELRTLLRCLLSVMLTAIK